MEELYEAGAICSDRSETTRISRGSFTCKAPATLNAVVLHQRLPANVLFGMGLLKNCSYSPGIVAYLQ